MTTHPCDQDTEDDIDRIFSYIDEENKGFISPEDLMACAEELKEDVTPAEIREMIAHCDPDGRGVITREAFIRFNKKKKFDWSEENISESLICINSTFYRVWIRWTLDDWHWDFLLVLDLVFHNGGKLTAILCKFSALLVFLF